MVECWHCKAESPTEHYDRVVHNRCALHGPWKGWRLAGRDLVSPTGVRMSPQRLEGLAWRLELEQRREARKMAARIREGKKRVRVVVVDLDDYRHQGIAAA
ncbi:DUF3653 domain-containing protein [Luteimonas sp. R10]|uniref:DUF3653 domain-containing protein n=1 Tax=Luteimonas sp. R10 TaxID=3108176 RepID=UPI003084E1AC|nr:DUF3653 domain-containing protein [Luteimonas sp. R10]